MMKTIATIILAIILSAATILNAQSVGINADGSTPETSAMLDVKSTDKGFLAPRMTVAQRDAIETPAAGLLVYQTDSTPGYYYYSGSAWLKLDAGLNASQWTSGTGNISYTGGNVGIGTTTPAYKLHIQDATSPALAIQYGTNSDYPYLSSNTINDLVIGSVGSGSHSIFKSNGNVGIGTTTPYTSLTVGTTDATAKITAGGANTLLTLAAAGSDGDIYLNAGGVESGNYSTSTRLSVRANGNVGIGTTTPTSRLMSYYPTTVNPSLEWGSFAPVNFKNEASELIMGLSATPPHPYYLQARTSISTGRDIVINPLGGNVGIGTTTPVSKLHVNGDISIPSSGDPVVQGGMIRAVGVYGSVTNIPAAIEFRRDNGVYTGEEGQIRFKTTNAPTATPPDRMVILGNGNVGIGTTTPDVPLTIATSGGVGLKINNGGDIALTAQVSGGNAILYNDDGNLQVSASAGSGAFCTGTTWTNASDSRLKRDIQPMSKYGLNTVMQLKPVTYYFKADKTNHPEVGFIAQEVQKIIPEVVSGKEGDLAKGETLGLSYGNMVPVLVKGMQDQQKTIESQQKQIDELKELVNKLMNK